MSFLDEVISTGKNVVSTAGTKGKEAVNFTKLKIRASQINVEIKAKYEKLGEMIYEMAKSGEKNNEAFDAMVAEVDALFAEQADLEKQVSALIDARQAARKEKNWAEADRIRDQLKDMGIVLMDTPQGVKWKKA